MGNYKKEELERIHAKKNDWAENKFKDIKENCSLLTEEQHDILAWLCSIRHKLHKNQKDCWYIESDTSRTVLNYFSYEATGNVDVKIEKVGLPASNLTFDLSELPVEDDFYYVLTDVERAEWDEAAEEINNNSDSEELISGVDLYTNKSGKLDEMITRLEKLNDDIERYLYEVDCKYGTNYCPSGLTR